MRAVFFHPERPEEILGAARWTGEAVELEPQEATFAVTLERIFRATPVAIDDPSLRSIGTSGPVVLPPGSLRWFQAAAEQRGPQGGLGVRMVPQADTTVGFDPAGTYRPLAEQRERTERADLARIVE